MTNSYEINKINTEKEIDCDTDNAYIIEGEDFSDYEKSLLWAKFCDYVDVNEDPNAIVPIYLSLLPEKYKTTHDQTDSYTLKKTQGVNSYCGDGIVDEGTKITNETCDWGEENGASECSYDTVCLICSSSCQLKCGIKDQDVVMVSVMKILKHVMMVILMTQMVVVAHVK